MNPNIQIFTNKVSLTYAVRDQFVKLSGDSADQRACFNVAFSGGSTPALLFKSLAKNPYADIIRWEYVHIYWVDERCVYTEHPDSNFGMTKRLLLDHVNIPKENIHRIRGEAEVKSEVFRYSQEIKANLSTHKNSFPEFDWVLLGLGVDGHTASLFSDTLALLERQTICTAAIHPQTHQKRISLTLPVINSAKKISFHVSGAEKRAIVHEILDRKNGCERYPASLIKPHNGQLEWLIDEAAAGKL